MDISSRNAQAHGSSQNGLNVSSSNNNSNNHKKGKRDNNGLLSRLAVAAGVAAVVVLLAAVTLLIAFSDKENENGSEFVDTEKLQAVFLNTGQVYFGNISTLNNENLVLTNIYYLQTTQSAEGGGNAPTNITLVKLGCELHEPYDLMVINSEQVTFWENLQDNGDVAKAVKQYKDKNPNGQKCADQSSSSGTTQEDVQNAGQNNEDNTSGESSENTEESTEANP